MKNSIPMTTGLAMLALNEAMNIVHEGNWPFRSHLLGTNMEVSHVENFHAADAPDEKWWASLTHEEMATEKELMRSPAITCTWVNVQSHYVWISNGGSRIPGDVEAKIRLYKPSNALKGPWKIHYLSFMLTHLHGGRVATQFAPGGFYRKEHADASLRPARFYKEWSHGAVNVPDDRSAKLADIFKSVQGF